MDCRVLRTLTLKSDGQLSCDDSNGYSINLGSVGAAPGWRLARVLDGPIFRHVRTSFAQGRVPWPGTCETCDLYSPGTFAHDTLDREIDVRVEATLACGLRCPSCKRGREAAQRTSTGWNLDPEVMRSLLLECSTRSIKVKSISYLGWGEPLDHPDFATLVEVARRAAPTSPQELTTIGNADFRSSIKGAALDRIVVSCDGVTQGKYERYRVGGSVAAAHRFMRDIRAYASNRPFVQWKYILFDHNDDDADILTAQRLADEFDVDSLLFIVTNSKGRSRRFTNENLHQFPLISKRATVSPAAALQRVDAVAVVDPTRSRLGVGSRAVCYVDRCHATNSNVLIVEGWATAVGGAPVDQIRFSSGSLALGRVATTLDRADVVAAFPETQSARCGFIARLPLEPILRVQPCEVQLDVHPGDGHPERFVLGFALHRQVN